MTLRRICAAAVGLALLVSGAAAQVGDFAFIHASDTHAPIPESGRTIASVSADEPLLFDDGVSAPRREWVVVTGDLTEFGGTAFGRAAFETYLGWWKPLDLRIYHVMGNHDATWDCLGPRLRELQGGANLAFERHGCKFLLLDSSTVQDPRPEFGAETLAFVRRELATTPESMPLFLFFHHPPYGSEWAGPESPRRLLRLLDGRVLAGLFVGHNHTAFHRAIDGADVLGGGSTFKKNKSDVGWNVVAVKDRVLRVAFREAGPERTMRPLLTKPLGMRYRFTPSPGPKRAAETKPASAGGPETAAGGASSRPSDRPASSESDVPGGSSVRAEVVRVPLEASVRCVSVWPTDVGGLVLAGLGDGRLVALEERSLKLRFVVRTDGAVLGRPWFGRSSTDGASDRCVFASGDGFVRAIDCDGAVLWRAPIDAPGFATPAVIDGVVIIATTAGAMVGLDLATGARLWSAKVADGPIETGPAVVDGTLVFGAWDEFVRRLGPDGDYRRGVREIWRAKTAGPASKKAAAKYWSPADSRLAVFGGKLFAADRAFAFTEIDLRDGAVLGHESPVDGRGIAAVAVGRAGRLWLTRTDNAVERLIPVGAGGVDRARIGAPTGLAPTPVAVLDDDAAFLQGLRGDASYVRIGSDGQARVVWTSKLFDDSFALAEPAATASPKGVRVVVGALDGTLVVVDFSGG